MAEYQKPWLPLEQQIERLADGGVDMGDHAHAALLLKAVGYYRLTGYLYPFRQSTQRSDGAQTRTCVLSGYRAGTTLAQVAAIIDFDRRPQPLGRDVQPVRTQRGQPARLATRATVT